MYTLNFTQLNPHVPEGSLYPAGWNKPHTMRLFYVTRSTHPSAHYGPVTLTTYSFFVGRFP
jgi:hypothetical protein